MTTERVESEGFFEMLWDCDHCDTKGLLGKSQRHCPECGAPQNPDKRYFPSPEQQKRVDGHSYEGADRHCPACNMAMAAKAKNCTRCGSPLDGSQQVRTFASTPPVEKKKGRRIWPYIVAGIVLVVVLVWYFFLRTRDAEVTVTGHRWQRVVAIEQFGEYPESAWRDQVPADASLPVCHRKQRSTRKVQDGETCTTERVDKGDGTFEQVKKCRPKYRSEPVDDDWCTFRVRRWKKVDSLKASGTGEDPEWPAGVPPADTPAALGAKRAGAREETLILDFGNDSCEVKDSVWRKYRDGQKIKVEVRARSGKVVCSSL